MPEVYETAIVEKRNVLNELRCNNMTLQELRFFSIYLSKINPWDISTRVVRFPLSDFQRIMGIGRMNMQHIRMRIDNLLMKIIHIPNERGGYTAFQLFKRCLVDRDVRGTWFVEIDANDDALPLMFDFKNRYFKYELWNALRLKSANQLRMYEILKQYEIVGKREISVPELRSLLGIAPDEYSDRWNNFKVRVLDSCQQALKDTTDICFTYERGKSGKGGKWLSVIFHIYKNEDYIDQLTLSEFIRMQPDPGLPETESGKSPADAVELTPTEADQVKVYGSEQLAQLAEACSYEFGKEEMQLLFQVLARIRIPRNPSTDSLEWGRFFYLQEKYTALNAADAQKAKVGESPIRNRFKYFLQMLEDDTFQPAAYTE